MTHNINESLEILYSLKHCPYAMRARLAILKSARPVILRNITLSNKPKEMLLTSPKGTVPILVVSPNLVIEESLEIMLWTLGENDPSDLLHCEAANTLPQMIQLISQFDTAFIDCLTQYKCAKRYREANIKQKRQACEVYLKKLEARLNKHAFLMSDKESLADIALLPFIRQIAKVERQWYLHSPYPKLRAWLNGYLQSTSFTTIMRNIPFWITNQKIIILEK